MKILHCACILGAIAALYPLAQRAPVRLGEASLAGGEALLAGGETLALASLENAHANLERAFAAFPLAAADPMPVAALGVRKVASAAAKIASVSIKPVVAAIPKALAFDDPRPNAYFDPKPIGPANPIVLASLGLIPVAPADLAPAAPAAPDLPAAPDARAAAAPPKQDFHFLAYYAFSEVPPPEKPADTVLNAFKDIPVGTPIEEIRRVAESFGLDFGYMKAVAKIESDFDPKQRTGSYIGLYQLSKYEFNRYGDGDILNARDNAVAAAYKILVEAELFELRTHKKPTLSDLYLIHQQGIQGAEEHVSHPDRVAWESMCATSEGQQRGEKWCKRAIWGNTLPEIKKVWKSVDNLTSGAFVSMWEQRVAEFYARYSRTADAAPAK
jgi:hypothetical protein